MMTPKPTDRLKKICPVAASQVWKFPSAAKSGFHMKLSPVATLCSGRLGSGVPRVSTRTSTIRAHNAIAGMAQRQKVSMPRLKPRYRK